MLSDNNSNPFMQQQQQQPQQLVSNTVNSGTFHFPQQPLTQQQLFQQQQLQLQLLQQQQLLEQQQFQQQQQQQQPFCPPQRDTFPLQIPRSPSHTLLRNNPQFHLNRQRDVLSTRTGTTITASPLSPALISPYNPFSPGMSPQLLPHAFVSQQQLQIQALSQQHQPLPTVGFSPSLHPCQQYPSPEFTQLNPSAMSTAAGAVSMGANLKSPRLLPSRRHLVQQAATTRRNSKLGVAVTPQQTMEERKEYVTPPQDAQGMEYMSLDVLPLVDMPSATLSEYTTMYYPSFTTPSPQSSTSSSFNTPQSPRSPPPTPTLNATQESEQITYTIPTTTTDPPTAATTTTYTPMFSDPAAEAHDDDNLDAPADDDDDDDEGDEADDAAQTNDDNGSSSAPATRPRGQRNPKTPHKVSEKRRREQLKTHFDTLIQLLPPMPPTPPPPPPPRPVESTNAPPRRKRVRKTAPVPKPANRIQILHHAMEYVAKMEDQHVEMRHEVERLQVLLAQSG
ncbi:hypothetical protein DFJ77DRAFT_459608 [Powellomyces hirtus]|nr:hypothetical protein DFJ77DRAFT_459608 [Powellomyces hirtus]